MSSQTRTAPRRSYIWLGQGGEKDVPFDDERALDALCTIWVKATYWRAAGAE